MKKFFAIFFILAELIISGSLLAAEKTPPGRRHVDLELESVEGARLYEIELQSKSSGRIQNFKMKTPHGKALITIGEYTLRTRSYDERKVPGAWSEPTPFAVKLISPPLLEPKMDVQIKTKKDNDYEVMFRWQTVPGAHHYRLDVTAGGANSRSKVISKIYSENSVLVELPVAKKYFWTVTAISKAGMDGESQKTPSAFTLIGQAIVAPEIEKPEDIWVEKLNWSRPQYAKKFNSLLQRKDNGRWTRVEKKENISKQDIPFPLTYPGGHYRLDLQATAPLREKSKIATREFDVYTGDRSPAAVEESKLRYSLEKPTPWYFVASYLLTMINYTGVSPDNSGNQTTYDNRAGTGRLGLGYINPNNSRGYLAIFDLSGIIIAGEKVTYKSAEAHHVWRYTWRRNLIRPSAGIFYKELIETTKPSSDFINSTVSFVGPHAGFDFWRPFTSKYGVQTNARVYYGMHGMKTPNDRDLVPEISYQVGLMGSYKLRPNITGFMGWARRLDKGSYKSTTAGVGGSTQKINLHGDYFNLLLEWGF